MAKTNVDYYSVLEVSPRASKDVIHAAYRALAKLYANDPKKLVAINAAKDVLLDDDDREEYDTLRAKPVGKKVGNYSITELIAEGGFGKTYKGVQNTLGTPVCIKHASKVSPQDEALMVEEANSIWDLRHYGIPNMRDMLKLEDGSMALVMSYIPGPTLAQFVEKHNKIEPEHVAWIAERILNILRYLHYNGVVHGDVKPQNIILQPNTHMVVLVDFGLSLIRPAATSTGKGYTPFFAPPEQISGGTLLPESDFYGLGMSMIFALGGDVEKKKVPSTTPGRMCDFIKRLIAHDVLQRPNWMKEDLIGTLQSVRQKEFHRSSSNMKQLVY